MARIVDVHRSEEGAVFVQVGIALFVLMAFNVFVLDYGMLWVARGQAQNAADAGALAGAVARGFDDFADPPSHRHSFAAQVARGVAQANNVWQEPATPVVNFNCPTGVAGRCTTIAVYRDGENGSSPLDTLFGPMLFVGSQRVRATATALTGNGNATPCLRPWAFADDWAENTDLAPEGPEFSHYYDSGPQAGQLVPNPRDEYAPPSGSYAGRTTVAGDFGERIVWEAAPALDPANPITRGLIVPLVLPGGRTFDQNMASCLGQPIGLNQSLRVLQNIQPQVIIDAAERLYERDAAADYDPGNRITNSCAPACEPVSPRLMAIALYDPQRFQLGRATNNWMQADVGCPTNHPCIRVTNIIGFFIHQIVAGGGFGPHGHFVRYPGVTVPSVPTFVDDGSWLVTTHLIR
jgi:Putative Flp pilus-assembly TadE/G-like